MDPVIKSRKKEKKQNKKTTDRPGLSGESED